MSDWIGELNERSKNDLAIIVGSEVRQLCGEIATSHAALAKAQAEVEGLMRLIADTTIVGNRIVAERDAAEKRAEEAERSADNWRHLHEEQLATAIRLEARLAMVEKGES